MYYWRLIIFMYKATWKKFDHIQHKSDNTTNSGPSALVIHTLLQILAEVTYLLRFHINLSSWN